MGVQLSARAELVEACGSPGEVGTEPARGHRYGYKLSDEDSARTHVEVRYDRNGGNQMLWTSVVLGARDQLRHRVAFALSQASVTDCPLMGL